MKTGKLQSQVESTDITHDKDVVTKEYLDDNYVKGIDNRTVLSGARVPATDDGIVGDFWIDISNDDYKIYGPKIVGGIPWGDPTNMIGIDGEDGVADHGEDGVRGSQIFSGVVVGDPGAPPAGSYLDGDYFLDTTTSILYGAYSEGSAWDQTVLKGLKGEDGKDGDPGNANVTGLDQQVAIISGDDNAIIGNANMTYDGTTLKIISDEPVADVNGIKHVTLLDLSSTNYSDTDTSILIGNGTYGWQIKYFGESSGSSGNQYRIESTFSGVFIQLNHDGLFEIGDIDNPGTTYTILDSSMNLNADTVDGKHASAFALTSDTRFLTVDQKNQLTQGSNTTLHSHALPSDLATEQFVHDSIANATKTMNLTNPIDGDQIAMFYTNESISIDNVRGVNAGGTSGDEFTFSMYADIHLFEASIDNPPQIVVANKHITGITSGNSVIEFGNKIIPAQRWVWVDIEGPVNSDNAIITLDYSLA
jgi:hypothetical protein